VSYAGGHVAEAAAATQKQLALLSSRTTGSRIECFYAEEALERLRHYTGEVTAPAPAACSGSPRFAILQASAR
jgi:hypothetical protein